MGRNKLSPDKGGLLNYVLSFGIAVVWIIKWIFKLLKYPFVRKGK